MEGTAVHHEPAARTARVRNIIQELGPAEEWAIVPLRVLLGFGFAAHGNAKLSRGPDKFAEILNALGRLYVFIAVAQRD
jgi:hypothetical protein